MLENEANHIQINKLLFGLSIWSPKFIIEGLKPENTDQNPKLANLYMTAASIFMWEGSKYFIQQNSSNLS